MQALNIANFFSASIYIITWMFSFGREINCMIYRCWVILVAIGSTTSVHNIFPTLIKIQLVFLISIFVVLELLWVKDVVNNSSIVSLTMVWWPAIKHEHVSKGFKLQKCLLPYNLLLSGWGGGLKLQTLSLLAILSNLHFLGCISVGIQ